MHVIEQNRIAHEEWLMQHLEELEQQGIKVFKLSTTEREEFKRCRRKWDFASLSRQGLEPRKPAQPLWFGHGIHHGLELYYREQKNPAEEFKAWAKKQFELMESYPIKFPEAMERMKESVSLGAAMLDSYVAWATVQDAKDFAHVRHTEMEFQVPVRDFEGKPLRFTDGGGQVWEIHLVGRLDLVVEDWDGKYWIMDHKTSADKLNVEILLLNDQMTVYLWAAQQIFKVEFEGALYNVLRKKLPTVPRLIQNGTRLSKDKSIDTTYEVYLAEIEKHGFDPEEYSDILQHLQEKEQTFFQREKVRRNQTELATAGAMLRFEGVDMLNAPFIYPNATWDCRWDCDFVSVCKAMNRGDDWQYLIETMYQKRDPGEGSAYNRESTIE